MDVSGLSSIHCLLGLLFTKRVTVAKPARFQQTGYQFNYSQPNLTVVAQLRQISAAKLFTDG